MSEEPSSDCSTPDLAMADRPNDETWYSRALPILQAVREVEGTDEAHAIPIGALAERLSLDPGHVAVEVERLIEGGYLSEKLVKPMGGRDVRPWRISNARLAPAGARAVRAWPSSDPYEALLALLERRLAEAPDEDTRSRLRKVRDTIKGPGPGRGQQPPRQRARRARPTGAPSRGPSSPRRRG